MAGSRIKGITVEIGGDTTKLQTALKKVNSEVKNTEAQLKDVEKLLKLDPGNTELLCQKQKLLSGAVSETKEKLETLKTAAEQANQALQNGDISKEQYDALQREIIETEQDLKKLEEQANQSATAVQKIASSGEKLKSAGDTVSSAGQKLLPVSAAVTAVGVAAVKTASDFDASMSQVAAVSGATGDDFDKLRDKAREMGAKTKFSASEAADAMNYMAMAGWKTDDMLSGIEGIMNLAAASGEGLATTSDIVTDALTAFGLTAADSGHFADILAAASSNANTNVALMGETFKYCAPIAGALGFSAEDTAEAIGLMANAGIKSTQAGTSLRTIMNNLTGEVKLSGDAIGDVTIATTNADGSMRNLNDILADCRSAFGQLSESEKAQNAEALVGKNAMSGFLALMNAAPGDISKLDNAIKTCDGTAEKMAETMQDNLQGQLTILMSQLQELAISFADLMMPAIRKLVTMLQGLVDFLNKLPGPVKEIILVVALLVAALGPVLIFVGKIMSSVGTIMTMAPKIAGAVNGITGAVKGIGAATSGVGAVLKAFSGIGLVIAGIMTAVKNFIDMFTNGFSVVKDILMGIGIAIAAVGAVILGAPAAVAGVVAAIVYAIANLVIVIKEHWTEIGSFLSGLWESMKALAASVWQAISDTIGGIVSGIGAFLSGIWTNISTTASTIWTAISTTVGGIVQGIVDKILAVWNGFISVFGPLLDAFKYLFETIFQAIQILIGMAMDAISSKIQEIWNGIVAFLTPLLTALQGFIETIWTAVTNFFTAALTTLQGIFTTIWNAIYSVISTVLTAIQGVVSSIWNAIGGFITSVMNTIKNTVSNIWNSVKQAVSTTITEIYNTIKSGFDNAVSYIKGLASQAFSWGRDLIMGIVNGIKSAVGAVTDAVNGVANKIRSVLHFSVPDEGPLTDYESWMPDFMKGLAKGIEESRGLVSKAMDGVTSDLILSPQLTQTETVLGAGNGAGSLSAITAAVREGLSGVSGETGDIMIPVYIGQDRIDEIVVTASKRADYRSGGR